MNRFATVFAAVLTASVLLLSGGVASATDVAPVAPVPACELLDRPIASPLTTSWDEADLFAAHAVCPRTGGAVRLGAGLLIATRDFYGFALAGGRLDGRYNWRDDIAFTASLDFFQFQFVQNATISDSRMALGQLTLGALLGRFETHNFSFVPSVRIMVPTATRTGNAREMALDPALMFAGSLRPWLDLYGSFGYAFWGAATSRSFNARNGPTLVMGLSVAFTKRFSFLAQLDALAWVGKEFVVRRAALSGGFRLRIGKGLRLELSGGRSLGGTDKTDINAGLTVSWYR